MNHYPYQNSILSTIDMWCHNKVKISFDSLIILRQKINDDLDLDPLTCYAIEIIYYIDVN